MSTADERVPDDYFDDDVDQDDYEEFEEECCGFFESQSPKAVFVCGAVGSEDCDECPMHNWLGLTSAQIDEMEDSGE